ncbi:MAG: Serine aminopeptidase [Patescibacteria group bacterium]|nr:alpha/beta fold hydrolase [Candidatus Saccharibacteria bacterium]MDQ5962989.1 Serine aminopeptidase [Patescibacteria group bacterium]
MKNQTTSLPSPSFEIERAPRALGQFDYYAQHSQAASYDNHPVKYDFFEPDISQNDDPTPILINNGYCAPAIVYDALAIGLAQNGRRVIRIHPPRCVSLGRRFFGGHVTNPLKKHAQAAWAVTKHASQEFGFDQIDTLGHSMGTPISLMLAAEKPQAVRSVMCTGGAGLDGAGGFIAMSAKGAALLKHEVYDERAKIGAIGDRNAVGREVARHILSHPLDTLAEGYYVSRANATPSLRRARAAGVLVGALLFEKDSFFKADAVLRHIGSELDYSVVIPDAKHIHPQLYPTEHAREQVEAFAALNTPRFRNSAA